VLIFYYKSKLQERQLTKQAHLRAIYETGSKLTHDVKNIIQAAKTLTQAVLREDRRTDEAQKILRKQLPLLTERLQSTLDKLSAPVLESTEAVPLKTWWQDIQAKYAGRSIQFFGAVDSNPSIPLELFNTVTENLLENARTKKQVQPDLSITVTLDAEQDDVQLRVCDSGSPVALEIRSQLFNEVVSSEDGFGIGLYHSSQLAKRAGYRLVLESNDHGHVCFVLSSTDTENT